MYLNKYHAKELHFHHIELHQNWLIILLKTTSLRDIILLQYIGSLTALQQQLFDIMVNYSEKL